MQGFLPTLVIMAAPRGLTVNGHEVGLVRPAIGQRLELSAVLGNLSQDVEQIPCRAGQPVKPRHRQHIAPLSLAISLCSSARSVLAPLAVSLYTFTQPAA